MARVTVFSIESCPYCRKAKGLLADNEIPYTEISLSDYPEKRSQMIKLAKQSTVPQIFFNEKHIGGATELENLGAATMKKFWKEAQKSGKSPSNEALEVPDYPPKPQPKASQREDEAYKGPKKTMSVVELVLAIEGELGAHFTGADFISWVSNAFGFSDRKEATKLASKIITKGVLASETNPHGTNKEVSDSTARYGLYRFSQNRGALNVFRKWTDREDDPLVVVTVLKKQLGNVLNAHRESDGSVNYAAASQDPEFHKFEEAICEVQTISLEKIEPKARKAFVINLYNTLTLHAFVKVGIPKTSSERGDFFGRRGYVIGGNFYSFNALENGLLRGNKTPPYALSKTIGPNDARRRAVLTLDPRIHTALNCGSKSCPPIKKFTREAVEEELDVAAASFFEQEENCSVDAATGTVRLSKIIYWYKSDFGSTNRQVLETVVRFLSGEKRAAMESLLASGSFTVKFNVYDWSTDANASVPFSKTASSHCIVS